MTPAKRNNQSAFSGKPVRAASFGHANGQSRNIPALQPANDNIRREQLSAYWHAARSPECSGYRPALTKMWWLP